ncbi:MAG TPA: hypothetical protein VJV23_13075 [Candidatus Polarisedimenticolia bacterium]|nr:hypothetical protein [Candidatus Polarisedimenticolia bacterium]
MTLGSEVIGSISPPGPASRSCVLSSPPASLPKRIQGSGPGDHSAHWTRSRKNVSCSGQPAGRSTSQSWFSPVMLARKATLEPSGEREPEAADRMLR